MVSGRRHTPISNAPLSDRLKSAMEKRGLKSAELARRAGVNTSFLYDVLSGKSANPSPHKLARVAETLGVALDTLVSASASNVVSFSGDDDCNIALLGGGASPLRFSRDWLRERFGVPETRLCLLRAQGDAMEPALRAQDLALIDKTQTHPSPPGLFAIAEGAGPAVKRLEYLPGKKRVRVTCDNPKYSSYDCSAADAAIIGRVIWLAREM